MNVLVVVCHPVPDSYNMHLAHRSLEALEAQHDLLTLDLYGGNPLPDSFRAERDTELLAWADAMVLVYPTWWASLPAPLMGWVEDGLDRGLWGHLTHLVAVSTHGSSRLVNAVSGEIGRRIVRRGLPAHMAPGAKASFIGLYSMDRVDDIPRQRFSARLGRRLHRALR